LWAFDVAGVEVWITESIFNTWMIMLFLIAVAIVVRIALRRFREVPSGFQNAVEAVVEFFDGIVKKSAGEKFMSVGGWFFMVFVFLLAANLSGIVGMRPPTADWATTFALSMGTFILIHAMGVRHRRGKYLKSFIEPIFIFLPLNIIGELARPISLSFRLFGNVLAGMILITLFYSLPIYLRIILPAALHAVFDIFFGALQTYVFCVLSMTFIGSAATSIEDI